MPGAAVVNPDAPSAHIHGYYIRRGLMLFFARVAVLLALEGFEHRPHMGLQYRERVAKEGDVSAR